MPNTEIHNRLDDRRAATIPERAQIQRICGDLDVDIKDRDAERAISEHLELLAHDRMIRRAALELEASYEFEWERNDELYRAAAALALIKAMAPWPLERLPETRAIVNQPVDSPEKAAAIESYREWFDYVDDDGLPHAALTGRAAMEISLVFDPEDEDDDNPLGQRPQ